MYFCDAEALSQGKELTSVQKNTFFVRVTNRFFEGSLTSEFEHFCHFYMCYNWLFKAVPMFLY